MIEEEERRTTAKNDIHTHASQVKSCPRDFFANDIHPRYWQTVS